MEFIDNEELVRLGKEDQSDRSKWQAGDMVRDAVVERDTLRRERVLELLKLDEVKTPEDYRNAGLIFHHGPRGDSFVREMAVKLMRKAVELDRTTGATNYTWLLAATIDRELMDKGRPQIYGTQHHRIDGDGAWELYTIDPTKISDEERRNYGVDTLAEQKEAVIRMNMKKLIEIYSVSENLEEVIEFCENKYLKKTDYDLSWRGMSRFGFQLKRLGKEAEAFRMIELVTKLYPQEFDPHHSLGVFLVEQGREEEAIKAFERSLALRPDFGDALRDLAKLKERK